MKNKESVPVTGKGRFEMKKSICLLLSVFLCAAALLPAGAAVRGDVDRDGVLSASDARLALRQSVELETYLPGSLRFQAADADGNGEVTAGDARTLLRRAVGLSEEEAAPAPEAGEVTAEFALGQTKFALDLLKNQTKNTPGNVLLSSLSASYALAMTANGAAGDTQKQLLDAMGAPDADTLNAQLYALAAQTPQTDACRLTLANSIWINRADRAFVQPGFLRTNLRWYDAGVNLSDFDDAAPAVINNWASEHTDGMIPSIVDRTDPSTVMILMNALCMDAQWEQKYSEGLVSDWNFTTAANETVKVKMMQGEERLYLENENAVGFIKPYAGGFLRFAAILPRGDLSMDAFLETLDAQALADLLNNAQKEHVKVKLPKFSFSYNTSLKRSLSDLGVTDLFTPGGADLSVMLRPPFSAYVDDVLQKTFIDVDSEGTRAAAVTAVIITKNGLAPTEEKRVILDRPFLFVITAGEQNVPVFIGVVGNPAV